MHSTGPRTQVCWWRDWGRCVDALTSNPCAVILAYRKYRHSDGKDIPINWWSYLLLCGFSKLNLICTPNRASLLTSAISSLLFLNPVGRPPRLNSIWSWAWGRGWSKVTELPDTHNKTRNKEERGGIQTWSWCEVFWTTKYGKHTVF